MIHVHPLDDIEEHDLEGTQCKCNPQVIIEPNAEIIVVHNSFDGREGVEWANEILKTKINMTIEQIAQVAHEINAAFCRSIGDDSQPTWDDAPNWQKLSAKSGVAFHLNNPDASPSASHENWLKQKEEEGWKYGPVKNPDIKEHPCFVPYEQLPTEQKSKDYLFKQIIHSLKNQL